MPTTKSDTLLSRHGKATRLLCRKLRLSLAPPARWDTPCRLRRAIATSSPVRMTGGRAAEELVYNQMSTGAANDIEQATNLARSMITRYGMSDRFGMTALETVQDKYLSGGSAATCSAATLAEVDKLVTELIRAQHDKAMEILKTNRAQLDSLASHLYEKETITGEEFMQLLNV